MTARAKRCMSFLVGIHGEEGVRIARSRLAAAADQSERSVKRSLAELVGVGWLTCDGGGGNGTASFIRVLNTIDWILAPVSRLAPDRSILAPVSLNLAPDWSRIKDLGSKEETQRALSVENFKPDAYARALADLRERVPGAHPDDLAATAQQILGIERKPPARETGASGRVRREA